MMSVLLVWLPVVLDICRQANPFGLAGCLSRTRGRLRERAKSYAKALANDILR